MTTLSGETVARDCMQEGELSCLLWSLIINKLFSEFRKGDYYTVDDIAVLVMEKLT
jgi:hypothetical protein